MIPEGVLVCLKQGILQRINFVYVDLKYCLKYRETSRYMEDCYKDLQDAVEFYFKHEIFGDKKIRRKMRVIDALYKQYEEMKKREVA